MTSRRVDEVVQELDEDGGRGQARDMITERIGRKIHTGDELGVGCSMTATSNYPINGEVELMSERTDLTAFLTMADRHVHQEVSIQ